MASYLVTGASRGLGLVMASQLASKPASEVSKVFAAVRTETDAVKQLAAKSNGRIELVPLDVTSGEGIKKAAAQVDKSLGDKGLDVLINSAGIMPFSPNGIDTMDDLDSTFALNVSSVHNVTVAFLPLLKRGNLKKVINISTTLGSIAMSPTYALYPAPAYKITKAALNMLTVQYAQGFADQGFKFVAISPGWSKTDLGGENADLDVETAAKATLDVVYRVDKADNGKFWNIKVPGWEKAEGLNQYDGAEVPW